jgi:hypothetical protein
MRFLGENVIAGNKLMCIDGAPLWLFGILSSAMFTSWIRTFAGKLESRFSISPDLAYCAFPFIVPGSEDQALIERAGQSVLDVRDRYGDRSLAQLYKPADMPSDLVSAHATLDRLVDSLYNLSDPTEEERSTLLLELHHRMQKEK